MNALVADVEKMLRRLIGEDIDLVMVPGAELGRVKADPGQIEQILVNLAVNARDAMPEGGKLVIETANVELDDAYARSHASCHSRPLCDAGDERHRDRDGCGNPGSYLRAVLYYERAR